MRPVRLYWGFQFFFSLLLWAPIFYEFQKRMGLSDPEIFRIQSIYYLAFCLLEIPTGWLADRLGHRACMRAGAVILVVAGLFPIFAGTSAGFLAHFLLIALSRSLISGASSAWIYEYLAGHGLSEQFKQIEGNARAYGLVGKVVCWAGVGLLMEWYLPLPYILTVLCSLAAVGFAFALPDQGPATQWAPLELAAAFRLLTGSPLFGFLILQGVGVFVLARIVQINLFQPILGMKGFSLASHGAVLSVISLCEAFGSGRPGWIKKRLGLSDINAVYLLTGVMAVSMALLPLAGPLGTLIGLGAFSLAVGFSYPIQRQLVNDAISASGNSRLRATLLSMESIVDRAVCAWVAAILGVYAAGAALETFLLGAAGMTLGMIAFLMIFSRFMRAPARDMNT